MNLPYQIILDELKKGPRTAEELAVVDKGDTSESLTCLAARGLVQFLDGRYHRNEEALERERDR